MSNKPNVVVSKCLGFAGCRYDGTTISDEIVRKLQGHVNFITICPEMEIGLGVPRSPVRIVDDNGMKLLYQPATGRDVTGKMLDFTNSFLGSLSDIDGFILKHRSPSCGPFNVKVYSGFDLKGTSLRGQGFFGGEAVKRFTGLAIEDEGRLRNFILRENFLTKLFLLARFREMKKKRSVNELITFHSDNKYLFMAYSQSRLKELGRIVSNNEGFEIDSVLQNYQTMLYSLLDRQPSSRSWINVMEHLYGGMSANLSEKEKKFFHDSMEEYRDERIPLSVLLKLIESWALRFEVDYLLHQSIFHPFPLELVEISDAGKFCVGKR